MNQWWALKWRLIHVMRPLSHVFIIVYHDARDINLLLVTSKKVSGSEERNSSKINTELFCICFECVCETWRAAAGLLVSVLTLTHLKTWLNDDIYKPLHVEIAEQCRNMVPSLLHLSLFIVCTFCFQMAIKNRRELERCRASQPQRSIWTESSTLWTERRNSKSPPWCMISSSSLARSEPWSPRCLSSSQNLWFSVGLSVNCHSRWHERVTALARRPPADCISETEKHGKAYYTSVTLTQWGGTAVTSQEQGNLFLIYRWWEMVQLGQNV